MSFLYASGSGGGGVGGVSLALNVRHFTGSIPVEHWPEPLDSATLNATIGQSLTLFVPNPAGSVSFDAGRLALSPAVWPHVYWDVAWYGDQIPLQDGPSRGFTPQVVGVVVGGLFAFIDGPGFPFNLPMYFTAPGSVPDPPEFRVVWNPAGGDVIDFANPSGGQTGSASWDDATKTLTIVPQTYHPPTVFHPQGMELVPPPQFVDPAPAVIPPVFGDLKSSPDPTAVVTGLVIPPVFGGLTVTPGSPDDAPPEEEPPPGEDPYGPPDGRPVVDSGDAVPGADRTGRSAAVRVSRVRPIGGLRG